MVRWIAPPGHFCLWRLPGQPFPATISHMDNYNRTAPSASLGGEQSLKGLIDTHFHVLELEKRGIEAQKLLEELHQKGFAGGMDIGVEGSDLAQRSRLLSRWPSIRLAAGIGPWGAEGKEDIEAVVERFRKTAEPFDVDCIGEIGLDNHWGYGTKERQSRLFIAQLSLAALWRKPVAIHARDADEDMVEILHNDLIPAGGILHCFSSSWQVAEAALDKGLYISFAGPITYRKNDALREMLAAVPDDRLLLETDSPYLSPEPYRGKTNTPPPHGGDIPNGGCCPRMHGRRSRRPDQNQFLNPFPASR